MKIIVVENYEEMSRRGAEIMAEVVRADPAATLGLATGTTPIGAYRELIRKYERGELSFREIRTVNLDEYVGLDGSDPHSYRYFMRDVFFSHIDIDMAKTQIPSGVAPDLVAECARYTKLLADHPQDIQLLGLGSDGHIGFNEPGAPFAGHTHVTELAESTIRDNARLFDRPEDVPTRAITMGIADVMQAKKILLMANGANKAEAVLAMVRGAVREGCPASVLQQHPDVTVILDREAAKLL